MIGQELVLDAVAADSLKITHMIFGFHDLDGDKLDVRKNYKLGPFGIDRDQRLLDKNCSFAVNGIAEGEVVNKSLKV